MNVHIEDGAWVSIVGDGEAGDLCRVNDEVYGSSLRGFGMQWYVVAMGKGQAFDSR